MTGIGQALMYVYEDSIHLECIAVAPEDRGQGKATQLMKVFTECSDETVEFDLSSLKKV